MKNPLEFFVRLGLAGLLVVKALDALFATALTAAYRLNFLGLAERLGRLTPGDDYASLIPLMEGVPFWLHGLWVLAGALYLYAALRVLLGVGKAHIPVLAGLAVEVAARILERPVIAAIGVRANPNPSPVFSLIIPLALPLLLALALWYIKPPARIEQV